MPPDLLIVVKKMMKGKKLSQIGILRTRYDGRLFSLQMSLFSRFLGAGNLKPIVDLIPL